MHYIIDYMSYWMSWNYWNRVDVDHDPEWLDQGIVFVCGSKTG
jgi:hypothetical protein